MAFAMPFLEKANKVVVFTVEDALVPGPTSEEAAEHLLRNGIDAKAMDVKRGGRSVGEAILDTANELNADLLVKSAYTHSRVRDFVFGGGTSHVLRNAELPVLTAH